ncbi:response regulator transcription factor [Enterobacter cloacae]|uniref:response regulator transcription factor n=1 Tax=Enterobacter cloacae TaxID=550 RepID=UPI002B210453|nr:LuxR C-terminal-related transcriptional regulator [Enterobacter cloacae]MEA5217562.1 LuxR C-terminal-related transcriptional regulator [Enterobacter cloacae]
MHIFSEDSFFAIGLKALSINLNIPEPESLIIFDTGQEYIYVLDDNEIKHLIYSDPVSAFILCRRSLINRTAGISIFCMLLSGWRFGCAKQHHPKEMTPREALIIRMIFLGISQKHIAMKLYISEKMVSTHKLNALHKLKIKNVAIFFKEYAAWYRLWMQYMNMQHTDTMRMQPHGTQPITSKE